MIMCVLSTTGILEPILQNYPLLIPHLVVMVVMVADGHHLTRHGHVMNAPFTHDAPRNYSEI